VTFYGTATDWDKDLLMFTWDFGDGTTDVSSQTVVNSTLTMDHAYSVVGPVLAYLSVTDGQGTATTLDPVIVDVQPPSNVEPVIDPLPAVYSTVGAETDFTAVATDPDSDPLTYTWDFNDGSELTVGNPVTHTYEVSSGEFGMLYTVYVDDGQGHNVSANGLAYVNWLPWIETPLSSMTMKALTDHLFEVTASDNDSADSLIVTWDFGDGTVMVGASVTYQYAQVAVDTDYTLTVYVDDSFVDPMLSHNVSSSATVTVQPKDTVPPTANAGPDQVVMAGETVTFDGSGSSDNVAVVNWTWTFTWNAMPVTLWGEVVTYVFDSEPASVVVTLTVEDADGNTNSDTMTVDISGWIPEFPMMLLPVLGTIVMMAALAVFRRRRE